MRVRVRRACRQLSVLPRRKAQMKAMLSLPFLRASSASFSMPSAWPVEVYSSSRPGEGSGVGLGLGVRVRG